MDQGVPSITAADAATATNPSAAADPATRPLIVDVRERNEFEQERVEGVVLLPISEFVARHQALPDEPREACLVEVARLADSHPDLAGRDSFDFPYITHVYWCDRA